MEDGREKYTKMAIEIHAAMQKQKGDDLSILANMYDYMDRFKKIMDALKPEELAILTEEFDGFYRYAKLLENVAGEIREGNIQVP